MAKRGRKPTPNLVKLMDNNPGKRPIPEVFELSTEPLGLAPDGTPDPERDIWNTIRRECPWLRRADRLLVQDFCRSWILKRAAEVRLTQLLQHSVRLTGVQLDPDEHAVPIALSEGDDKMLNTLNRMVSTYRHACQTIMSEIGLTPTSRTSLAAILDRGETEGQGRGFLTA